ncbi:MAG: hypothetical protein GY935_20960 [Gammaproteobacteria bacterium]|nr:hypothetical protein [Gammaproteobacteria bacterium]
MSRFRYTEAIVQKLQHEYSSYSHSNKHVCKTLFHLLRDSGLGESNSLEEESRQLYATAATTWISDSTHEQLDKLKNLL